MIFTLDIDVDALKVAVEKATKIDDAESFFEELTQIQRAKMDIKKLTDDLYSIEQDVKGLINTKAKALPAKTAPGRLEVPLRLTIASWVLSPSSARKTVTKVEASRASMGGVQRQRAWR